MTTVKLKWRPSTTERKAGAIYYQIIHNRVVRQLKTDYRVFANEWNAGEGCFATANIDAERSRAVSSIQERINSDIERFDAIIAGWEERNCRYDTDDIVEAFVQQSHEQSFFNFMHSVIDKLKHLNKYRTAENYITTLRSFARFRRNEDLVLQEFDSDLMMRYEAYLTGRGASKNTTSFYMRILRAVYNRAVEQELTEQRKPFKHVYTGIDKTVKRAISFAAIKRIKEIDLSQLPALDFARDMFLFSFYTRGMSFIDMAYLKKTDVKNGVIIYRRRKTGQMLSIKMERCMREIVAKHDDGHVAEESPYLLPILRAEPPQSLKQYRSRLQHINKSLKTIAGMCGLETPLTMYVARHSWASIAKSKNIPISVISDGMGHDSELTTRIYLASIDTAVIDRANSLILRGL